MDDLDLLRQYAKHGSEQAFRELVARHAAWVYAASLRQVGDAHLAEDITQAVFAALARKATRIRAGTLISGWLFKAVRFACADALKRRRCRKRHEKEAAMMHTADPASEDPWRELAPLLDPMLARLGRQARDAVILRFYEQKTLHEVGRALGISQDAAKKRVHRGILELRELFSRSGIALPAGTLVTLLDANAARAAPPGLALLAAETALTAGTAKAAVLGITQTLMQTLFWAKAKLCAVIISILSLAALGAMELAKGVWATAQPPAPATAPNQLATGVGPAETVVTSGDVDIAVVLAALQKRDHALRNFAVSFRSFLLRSFDSNKGGWQPLSGAFSEYVLKHNDGRWLVHKRWFSREGEENVIAELQQDWDGSLQRSLVIQPEDQKGGTITDSEGASLIDLYFFHGLGFHMNFSRQTLAVSMNDLLRGKSFSRNNLPRTTQVVRATKDRHQGRPVILLHLDFFEDVFFYHYGFWLDPARDYMIVRFECRVMGNVEPDPGPRIDWSKPYAMWATQIVEEAAVVNDVWVPMKIVASGGPGNSPDFSETRMEVTEFKVGGIAPEETAVVFPVGTEVVDTVKKVGYHVLDGGGQKFFEIYDSGLGAITLGGEVVRPAGPPVPAAAPAGQSGGYRPGTSTSGGAGPVWWIFLCLVVLSILAGTFSILRKWRIQPQS